MNEPRIFMNNYCSHEWHECTRILHVAASVLPKTAKGCNVLGPAEGFAIDVNVYANQQSMTAINQRPEGAINRYEVVLTEAELL